MRGILEELYREYYVQRQGGCDSAEIRRLWDARGRMEQELERYLPKEQGELFRNYQDTVTEIYFLECCEEFSDGVRLGGRLVMEMLKE